MEDKKLIEEMHRLNEILTRMNRHQNLTRSFFSGILYGFGSIIGATIIFAIFAYLLRNVSVVPLIGNWLAQIVEYVKSVTGT